MKGIAWNTKWRVDSGSRIGTISGYYAEEAKIGGVRILHTTHKTKTLQILVEAVESNSDILSTGQKFFDNSNTSRVTYLNEDLMKMVDHSFKMGQGFSIYYFQNVDNFQESNTIRFM